MDYEDGHELSREGGTIAERASSGGLTRSERVRQKLMTVREERSDYSLEDHERRERRTVVNRSRAGDLI